MNNYFKTTVDAKGEAVNKIGFQDYSVTTVDAKGVAVKELGANYAPAETGRTMHWQKQARSKLGRELVAEMQIIRQHLTVSCWQLKERFR